MSEIDQGARGARRFQRLLFVGKTPIQLEHLPARDDNTLVVMADRRLAWVGHFMRCGAILVVLDEILDPSATKTAERRVDQIDALPGIATLRLLFNARSQVDERLRAAVLAGLDVLTYGDQRRAEEGFEGANGSAGPDWVADPMGDMALLAAVIDDFAAEGAELHFWNFDDEFQAIAAQDPHSLGVTIRTLARRGHSISTNSTTFDLQEHVNVYRGAPEPASAFETKASLIIPLYNAEQFITSTLQSIVDQNFESLEVVIIDDGSTDKSPQMAQEFANKFKKFTYVEQENQGVSAARNRGLSVASGQYIGFLDADDLLLPDSIKRRVDLLETSTFRVCGGHAQVIDDDARSLNLTLGRQGQARYEDMWEVMYHISTIMGQSRLMKSQTFRVGQSYAEDWRYMVDLAADGDRFGYCGKEPLSSYRWHRASATGKEMLDHFDTCINFMTTLPVRPQTELDLGTPLSGPTGVKDEKLYESIMARTQTLCLSLAIKEGKDPLDQRVIDLMNAIDEKFARPVPDARFENILTRALLLPRFSEDLHRSALTRAPDTLKKLKALAPTPANKAFTQSFRNYLKRLKNPNWQERGDKKGRGGIASWFRRKSRS